MAPQKAKQWILNQRPKGVATYSGESDATFKLVETDLPELKDDQVLLKALYLSNDPAQRTWISEIPEERHYTKPVAVGDVMRAGGLAEVVESKSDKIKQGSTVLAYMGWRDYMVTDAKTVQTLPEPPKGLSISHYLGALGMTGLTAYYGLVVKGEAKADQSLVVSGAAGATGSMVVQIAKHIVGMKKVIGIAGTDEKCKWVESIGADKCLNYKSDNFEEELQKATDRKTDIYFDNVAGDMLDKNLGCMKKGGVIVACGGISGYNSDNPMPLSNYMQVVVMTLSIRGFIVLDYLDKQREVQEKFVQAIKDGKLKITDDMEHVVPTKFEDIPGTWLQLFEGGNQGKLITKLTS